MEQKLLPSEHLGDFIVKNHPEVKALFNREKRRMDVRIWRKKNKARHNQYQKEYRLSHQELVKTYQKKYYLANSKRRNWYPNMSKEQREELKLRKSRIRLACLLAYSNGKNKCACCGENQNEFLTIDHINNDGRLDKTAKAKKRMGGNGLYGYLKKRGFPNKDRYQVLCWNCNCAKGINGGVCPHKQE